MCRLRSWIFNLFLIAAGFSRSLCQVEFVTESATIGNGAQGSTTQQLIEYQVTTTENTPSTDDAETTDRTLVLHFRSQPDSNENENSTVGNIEPQPTTVDEVSNATDSFNEPASDRMDESTTFAWYSTATEVEPDYSNRPESTATTTDKYTEETHEGTTTISVTTEESVTTTGSNESHLTEIEEKEAEDRSMGDFTTIPETEETTTVEVDRETEIAEDFVEKQINEAINSMPKLPELVLSDNKTHFKFHKNSEEMLIDEKITQIARQLAEKSLREKYEERKLGHSYLKKSKKPPQLPEESKPQYRLKKTKVKSLLPSKFLGQSQQTNPSDTKSVLTSKKSSPKSAVTVTETTQAQKDIYEKITDLSFILKLNKTDVQIKEISDILKLKTQTSKSDLESIAPIPITFRTASRSRDKLATTTEQSSSLLFSLLGQEKPEAQVRPDNATFYAHETVIANGTDV